LYPDGKPHTIAGRARPQQFNSTDDRKTERADGMLGVACFDCHVNGHTSGAAHLVGDIRPQENRRRIETTSLRGVNIQRLFGSQRALKTVEDFTEFEQRAAYFDGDPVIATKKGVNVLERASQVHFMAEFQELLDFPSAPKLNIYGRLDRSKAERPGEARSGRVYASVIAGPQASSRVRLGSRCRSGAQVFDAAMAIA
jgi:hypothetical protein